MSKNVIKGDFKMNPFTQEANIDIITGKTILGKKDGVYIPNINNPLLNPFQLPSTPAATVNNTNTAVNSAPVSTNEEI